MSKLLKEAAEYLFIARRAASKLNVMYIRHEIEPRYEIDELLAIREKIAQLISAINIEIEKSR